MARKRLLQSSYSCFREVAEVSEKGCFYVYKSNSFELSWRILKLRVKSWLLIAVEREFMN